MTSHDDAALQGENDPCPAQTEGLAIDLVCDWPDGHAGLRHWDAGRSLLWEQPREVPSIPPYRGQRIDDIPLAKDERGYIL